MATESTASRARPAGLKKTAAARVSPAARRAPGQVRGQQTGPDIRNVAARPPDRRHRVHDAGMLPAGRCRVFSATPEQPPESLVGVEPVAETGTRPRRPSPKMNGCRTEKAHGAVDTDIRSAISTPTALERPQPQVVTERRWPRQPPRYPTGVPQCPRHAPHCCEGIRAGITEMRRWSVEPLRVPGQAI